MLSPASASTALPRKPAPSVVPETREHRARAILAVGAQVVVITWLLHALGVESSAFRRVVALATAGFVLQFLVPGRWRLAFFAALSVGGLVFILGGRPEERLTDLALGVPRALVVLGVGGVLFGICHLPIRFGLRVGLLIAAGTVIATFRLGAWEMGSLTLVWPVVAALVMFRVMVYLYDVSSSPQRPTWSQSIAYLVPLPNICALLFPVLDFRAFQRGYSGQPSVVVYQRGAVWMTRGLIHLLVYRAVVLIGAIPPAEVVDGTDVARFVLSNSLLYLKVSGTFHLIAGMLLLFGFDLPETNHRYFLASSFTDYWRRVNTYWRAFVMKVFYYPAFFRLKKLGQTRALILATAWTFVITWVLHLYQTFWLKGSAWFSWPDTLFWSTLALLVLVNSLWELRRGRTRKLPNSAYTPAETVSLVVRTAGTFAIISALWSLWSSPSIPAWMELWAKADWRTLGWGLLALSLIGVATIVCEVWPANRAAARRQPAGAGLRATFWANSATLAGLVLLSTPWAHLRLDVLEAPGFAEARAVLGVVLHGDARGRGQGYYENLTSLDRTQTQLADTFERERKLPFPNPIHVLPTPRLRALQANVHIEQNGVSFHTNRYGMRDREYDLRKPAGTLRIAVLGSSHVMGYGLLEHDMFERISEEQLNQRYGATARFEVMNFAVGGQSPLGQIAEVRERVAQFSPDLVVFVAHLVDPEWTNRDLVQAIRRGVALPHPTLLDTAANASVTRRTNEDIGVSRLRRFEPEMLAYCYREIVNAAKAAGAQPVCVFLPTPSDVPVPRERATVILDTARQAGFVALDLSNVYAGHDPQSLSIADAWRHCNPEANRLIAAALLQQLTADPHIDLSTRVRRLPYGTAARSAVLPPSS